MQGKILLIDDDETIRRTISLILERDGYVTDVAATGAEAKAALANTEYDLAVVDLLLPDLSGIDLLKWAREHAPGVVSVVLSGTTSPEEAAEAVQQGAYDFVAKPVTNPHAFCHRIQGAIRHKRLAARHDELLKELEQKNTELENRLAQLELAYHALQAQAVAIQVDLNRAMHIQRGLLPRELPFSDKVSMAAAFHPMDKVGGDLYDVFPLDARRLGLYIADTSGHGVSGAMLTLFLRRALEPAAKEDSGEVRSPGHVLRLLNDNIIRDIPAREMFVSMIYLIVDVDTMEVSYSCAGHPPLLLRRTDGTVEPLHVSAPVLGVNSEVRYTQASFQMNPGDLMLLYTDGAANVNDDTGEPFGAKRLRELVSETSGHVDELVPRLEDALVRYSESCPWPDDVTIVALGAEPQRTPLDASMEGTAAAVPVDSPPAVRATAEDGRLFISVSGAGSWQESQRVLQLCNEARDRGDSAVILDLEHCLRLDSTFYGVLHEIATSFDGQDRCNFEIQNVPHKILREFGELGLTAVLMHFRPEPLPLPASMRPIETTVPARAEMGRLLLSAHEALVAADPKNADRFAAVLKLLHEQAQKHGR